MKPTLYGIKNCDTVRRARKDLAERGVDYRFHDFRAEGIEPTTISGWVDMLGIDQVLNRRGTTWRKLGQQVQDPTDVSALIALMAEHPSLIKRPVFQRDQQVQTGYPRAEAESRMAWFAGAEQPDSHPQQD